MRIVFYYNNSYLSVFLLTAIEDLITKDHSVYLLTTSPAGDLHERAEKLGANVFSDASTSIYGHWRELIRFCRKHEIDFVFSHLQYPNLVAVLSQYFIKASVWPMRHHADDVYLSANKNALKMDKTINALAKRILVVSAICKRHMTLREGVSERKIIVMPLYYNFDLYAMGKQKHDLPAKSDRTLKLISIGRMVANKNHIDLLNVVKRLTAEGVDLSLILLDTGPLENDLKKFVLDSGLGDRVSFLGRQTNVMGYIRAADLLIHTSISESSPQVTKEAGVCCTPVVVVKDTGDVDEYVIDGKNGVLLPPDNIRQELYLVLKRIYADRSALKDMGKELDKAVRGKFGLNSATKTYQHIIQGTIR